MKRKKNKKDSDGCESEPLLKTWRMTLYTHNVIYSTRATHNANIKFRIGNKPR